MEAFFDWELRGGGIDMTEKEDQEFDLAIIDGLRGLQAPGDPDLVDGLVETFLTFLDEKLPALRSAHGQGDRDEVRELAHALKGAAASVGARGVARICEDLERGEAGVRAGGADSGPPDQGAREALLGRLESALAHTRQMLLAQASTSR
jgi:HPt (histidine-containing phosphotransfer) domain-containing protein